MEIGCICRVLCMHMQKTVFQLTEKRGSILALVYTFYLYDPMNVIVKTMGVYI